MEQFFLEDHHLNTLNSEMQDENQVKMNNIFTTQPGFMSTSLDKQKALEYANPNDNDDDLDGGNKVRVLLEIELV